MRSAYLHQADDILVEKERPLELRITEEEQVRKDGERLTAFTKPGRSKPRISESSTNRLKGSRSNAKWWKRERTLVECVTNRIAGSKKGGYPWNCAISPHGRKCKKGMEPSTFIAFLSFEVCFAQNQGQQEG